MSRRNGFDRLAGGCAALVVVMWLAYGWEAATGLTFATRFGQGGISTSAHLDQTRTAAIGITFLCLPIAVLYFAFLRPKE